MIVILFETKPPIIQLQFNDYFNGGEKEVLRTWVPNEYQIIRDNYYWLLGLSRKSKSGKKVVKYSKDKKYKAIPLDIFTKNYKKVNILSNSPDNPFRSPGYFKTRRHLYNVSYKEYAQQWISPKEWGLLHDFPEFSGYFEYIFYLNNFSFIDLAEAKFRKKGETFHRIYLHDFIAWSFVQLTQGFRNFTGFERFLEHSKRTTRFSFYTKILHNPYNIPTAKDMSYILKKLPTWLFEKLFYQKVKECIKLKIIDTRVLVWDTTFIRANCNNKKNPKTKKYNDPDAGFCRHLNKRKGVGYKLSCLYAHMGSYLLPVYFKLFPGNRNESYIFCETLKGFQKLSIGSGGLILADTGAYSLKNLSYCIKIGRIPLIRARKNIKSRPIVEVEKGYFFDKSFLPKHWTNKDVRELYKMRAQIEAYFGTFKTAYKLDRLNTLGIASATKRIALALILDLCKAITAYKIGRNDLIVKKEAVAFPLQEIPEDTLKKYAKKSGFLLLEKWQRRRPTKKVTLLSSRFRKNY